MNANEYIKVGAIVPVSNDTIKELIDFIRKQQTEIEYWKEMFEKAMKEQEK